MSNRKAAEEFLLEYLTRLDTSGYNTKKYKEEVLPKLSDKAFHEYMVGLRDGSRRIVIFAPSFKTSGFPTDEVLACAEHYKLPMFERLVVTNSELPDYTTTQEFLLLDLPARRQSQNLFKKASIPDDNKTIDYMTYQPTGESKGSSLSQPEFGVLNAMGLGYTVEELFRFRGGDKGGFRAYNESVYQFGSVNLESIYSATTGVESTKALKNYLLGMGMILKD